MSLKIIVVDPSGNETEIKPKDLSGKERIRILIPKDVQFEKDAGFGNHTFKVFLFIKKFKTSLLSNIKEKSYVSRI